MVLPINGLGPVPPAAMATMLALAALLWGLGPSAAGSVVRAAPERWGAVDGGQLRQAYGKLPLSFELNVARPVTASPTSPAAASTARRTPS
ncbi:MAG: hypothetical protein M3N17_03320 [Actinomycetota bacterium]|nr:hypothetical protein [Actinomycetota bacterium]